MGAASPFDDAGITTEFQKFLQQKMQGTYLQDNVIANICDCITPSDLADIVLERDATKSLGSQYVLGLRAENCRNLTVLDEEQAQVAKKEDVLSALSQIAGKFRSPPGMPTRSLLPAGPG